MKSLLTVLLLITTQSTLAAELACDIKAELMIKENNQTTVVSKDIKATLTDECGTRNGNNCFTNWIIDGKKVDSVVEFGDLNSRYEKGNLEYNFYVRKSIQENEFTLNATVDVRKMNAEPFDFTTASGGTSASLSFDTKKTQVLEVSVNENGYNSGTLSFSCKEAKKADDISKELKDLLPK